MSITTQSILAQSNVNAPPISAPDGQFDVRDWRSYTSILNTYDGVLFDQKLWIATSGGVFSFDPKLSPTDVEYDVYRNIDALLSMNITAVAKTSDNKTLIAGANDGIIEMYSPETKTWQHVVDIRQASQTYTRRQINRIVVNGQKAYIATQFGIVVYDLVRNIFVETVDKIGPLEQKVSVNDIQILNDTLFAATEFGIFSASIRSQTLRLPSVWSKKPVVGTSNPIISLEVIRDSLYGISQRQLYVFKDTAFVPRFTASAPIVGITNIGTTLYYSTDRRYGTIDNDNVGADIPLNVLGSGIRSFMNNGTEELIICTSTSGVLLDNKQFSSQRLYTPNSPPTSTAKNCSVSPDGTVWIATSERNLNGAGVNVLTTTGKWLTMNTNVQSRFPSNSVHRVSSIGQSECIAGMWGEGACKITVDDDTLRFEHYTTPAVPFSGINGNPSYVLTSEAVVDSRNTLWIVNTDPTNSAGAALVSQNLETKQWTAHTNPINSTARSYSFITIDANNTKWLGGVDGLLYYNNRQTPVWGTIRETSTLADRTITALTTDRNGFVWIGTPGSGLYIISNAGTVLNGGTPTLRRLPILNTQIVNDIYVDGSNNKWIATNIGIWVINDDGTQVIGYINKERNPELLSNEVTSLAMNEANGVLFMATTAGLNSVQTLSRKPVSEFSITCYPQPFNPNKTDVLTIDGLEAAAEIRITTSEGTLVRKIMAAGARAIWDARDEFGTVVPSGVYLLHSVSSTNATSFVTKFAVVKE